MEGKLAKVMKKGRSMLSILCILALTVTSVSVWQPKTVEAVNNDDGSEKLTGTGWWDGKQVGRDYTLSDNSSLQFSIKVDAVDATIQDDPAYTVEAYFNQNGQAYYFTTNSNGTAWFAEQAVGDGSTVNKPTENQYVAEAGHLYTVTMSRSGNKFKAVYYDETTRTTEHTITGTANDFYKGNINVHIMSQVGTITVSQITDDVEDTSSIIDDNTTAMSMSVAKEDGETDVYAFDHSYVKEGDTLKVTKNGTEYTEDITWTVKQAVSGKENNAVSYKTIDTKTSPSLTIKKEYLESVIYGEIQEGVKLTLYYSKTPVMYINSDTSYYDVSKEYTDKDTTRINLVGNDTYSNEEYWYNDKAQIKLRGNSTAYREKRPFKVKLDSKADLLGLGSEEDEKGNETSVKSKHWVLLANDIDHSLLRNKLLYDFSGDIGTEFYFHSTNVTLIYNGQYEGVYQLCEHRRVDEGRIDITDWTTIGEDAATAIANTVAEQKSLSKSDRKSLLSELETIMATDYSWIDSASVTYTGKLLSKLTSEAKIIFKFSDYGITLPATNGGFLAEMDFYSVGDDTLACIATNYGQPLYFSAPEPGEDATTDEEKKSIVNSFKNTSLYTYAKNYTQTFEYALHSDDFIFRNSDTKYATSSTGTYDWNWLTDGFSGWSNATYKTVTYTDDENDGKHYSELFDMDSLVNNFLFCEYAMNWDSMKNSFFFYKDVDQSAKIGPQWDFDWCWGNINMYNIDTNYPTSWQTTLNYFTYEQYYQSVQWNRMLIRDPYFVTLAYEKYKNEVRPIIEKMIGIGGLIDTYAEYLEEAGVMNDTRWSYTYNGNYYSHAIPENFEDSIASIKTFLTTRVAWLDKQFASVDTLINSLGYYKASDEVSVSAKTDGDNVYLTATTSDTSAKKIKFQINGTTILSADITDRTASASIANKDLTSDGLNVVVANEVGADGDYLILDSASKTGNYNVVKSNYTTFDLSKMDTIETSDDSKKEDNSGDSNKDNNGSIGTSAGNNAVTDGQTTATSGSIDGTVTDNDAADGKDKNTAGGTSTDKTTTGGTTAGTTEGTGGSTAEGEKPSDAATDDTNKTDQAAARVGETLKDSKTKAYYEVTKKNTVTYVEPSNQKQTSVTIPATVKVDGVTYKVTAIDNNAFKNSKKLSKVTIGNNVVKIGKQAFSGCSKLKSVVIGKKVTSIGKKAFYHCTALKDITIKSTKLTSKNVGNNAFGGINENVKVTVPKQKKKEYKKLLKAKGIGDSVQIK